MPLKPKQAWFLAFTAVFAVLAGFVFWGTWSTDVAPVMPDCPVSYPSNWFYSWFRGWMASGKFVPGDLKWFLGTPYFWQELQYVLALYCAGLGMAYFLRGHGLSRLASYGAGLLLAFCGYWMTLFSAGHLGWFQWMTYGVFAFGLVDRALEKGKARHWLLLGATLAWGSFYQPDLWLLFTVFTAAYFAFRWISVRTLPWKGMLMALAAFVVIGLPSFRSAIVNDLAGRDQQIAEGQTLGRQAQATAADAAAEREKRWVFVTNWSLPPAETVEFFRAGVNGDTSCLLTQALGHGWVRPYTGALGRPLGAPQGNYRQHSLYVGDACLLALLAVLLCLAGFIGFERFGGAGRFLASRQPLPRAARPVIVFFLVSAVLFWLLSLGRYCEPVYRVVFSLPMGDYLRAPVKWHHLTEFCLVVLAGFGLEALWRISTRTWWRGAIALMVFCCAVDLAKVDRRYCAPQPVDYQLQLADARQVSVPQTRQYLEQQGIRVLGSANGVAVIGRHVAPEKMKDPLPPFGLQTLLGILSALASIGILGYSVGSVSRRMKA